MNRLTILGGDLRTVELAKMFLNENKQIASFGIDIEDKRAKRCENLKEALNFSNIIIAPIPFSKDGENIFSKSENIKIKDLLVENKSKILIGGSIKNDVLEKLKQNYSNVFDLMKDEKLVINNTIATAEGAILEAIKNTDITIQNSKVLILGFGRVAKEVAIKFKALNANVTCSARKEKDFAWMDVLGFEKLNINNLTEQISKFDIIINTVPEIILNAEKLKKINKDTLIIDLASKPGGVDFDTAKQLNLKCIWALALPGKVAPKTSAKYIKDCIQKIIYAY